MTNETTNPIVFISYPDEGDMSARVAELAQWLRSKGVNALTDHRFENRPPPQGWRAWMQHSIEDADITLIVCTPRYKALFEKRAEPQDRGRGVTWESAVITKGLYDSFLKNSTYFPIVPDGGASEDIPGLLRDWDANHRFPSGNSRILSLIRDEITSAESPQPFARRLPGELSGADDPRLLPREGKVLGRSTEVGEVLAFLNGEVASATVCGHVSGSAGVGKTEVCKAALRRWLSSNLATKAFYVQVSDESDANRLLINLGEAVGLEPEAITRLVTLADLQPSLPTALFYLDNLESVADTSDGQSLLRALSQVPGVRLLASSRVALDGVLGRSIPVDRLDVASGCELFTHTWNGAEALDYASVAEFVDTELGGHALSITLLARLGRAYSWASLTEKWQAHGTHLAKKRHAADRLDSLDISFAITRDLLATEPGALDLWVFAALFPGGIDEQVLALWCRANEHADALLALIEHHLLIRVPGEPRYSMLPPVARYALAQALSTDQWATAFFWTRARDAAYECLLALSRDASKKASSEMKVESRSVSAKHLGGVESLFAADMRFASPDRT